MEESKLNLEKKVGKSVIVISCDTSPSRRQEIVELFSDHDATFVDEVPGVVPPVRNSLGHDDLMEWSLKTASLVVSMKREDILYRTRFFGFANNHGIITFKDRDSSDIGLKYLTHHRQQNVGGLNLMIQSRINPLTMEPHPTEYLMSYNGKNIANLGPETLELLNRFVDGYLKGEQNEQ